MVLGMKFKIVAAIGLVGLVSGSSVAAMTLGRTEMHHDKTGYPRGTPDWTAELPKGMVRKVMDGRTVLLESGEEVRLAGLMQGGVHNDPERAAALLERLIPEGSQVRIQEVRPGYVFLYLEDSGMFVNAQAVGDGISKADRSSLPPEYEDIFRRSEVFAQETGRGEWG